MSLKSTLRINKRYTRITTAFLLLFAGALIGKFLFTGTLVEASSSFLSAVAHDATLSGDGTTNSPLAIANTGVGTNHIANGAVTAPKIASGQVVKTINGLSDAVTLAPGSNVSLNLTGQTLTISSLLGLTTVAHDSTLTGDGTGTSPLGIPGDSVTSQQIASGQVVKDLNGLRDTVSLLAGSNITITPTGNNTLTIAAAFPPQQTSIPYINPLRVATLQWYNAIETGLEFPAGSGANQIAFDGAYIWVSRGTFGSVSKIRISDGTIVGTFGASGGDALGLAFDGANIWVACGDFSRSLMRLRASDGANLGAVTLPVDPFSLAFDGSYIWATTGGDNSVTKVRARDGAIVGEFNAGPSPLKIAFDGANMWVTNPTASTVTKIRASDGVLVGTFNVPALPNSLAFDGTNIWITHPSLNMVTKLRASDGAVLGTFAAGPSPVGVVFDGASIWVGNRTSNTVTKLRASDGVVLGTFVAGDGPGNLAFDGTNIWAINQGASTVSKL